MAAAVVASNLAPTTPVMPPSPASPGMKALMDGYYAKYNDGEETFEFCLFYSQPLAPDDKAQKPDHPWFYYHTVHHRLFDFAASCGVNLAAVERALEVGCGRGGALPIVRQRLPAAHIWATDIVDRNVEMASRHFDGLRMDFLTLDITHIEEASPIRQQPFDLIRAVSVFFAHMRNRPQFLAQALQNAASLLAPGGHLLLFDSFDVNDFTTHTARLLACQSLKLVGLLDVTRDAYLGSVLNLRHQFGYDFDAGHYVQPPALTEDPAAVARLGQLEIESMIERQPKFASGLSYYFFVLQKR
eukprot:EG_transcript_12639